MRINKNEALIFAALTFVCLLRCGYLGFVYTPYLDDYVQYGLYPTFEKPWQSVLTGGLSTVYTRPLASISDVFFWSRFYGRLSAALVIVTLFNAASAVLFYISLKRAGVEISPAAMVFFALTPVNTEGTYWLSAATRIVVSTFFAALCVFCLSCGKTCAFILLNLVSMCYYEQTAVFSLVLSVCVCFLLGRRRLAAAAVLNFLALMVFYRVFGGRADNAERLKIIGAGEFQSHFAAFFSELFKIFTKVLPAIIFRGVRRGAERISYDGAFLWVFCLATLLAVFWSCARKIKRLGKKGAWALEALLGLALFTAPFLPFFAIDGVWLNLRNIAPTLLGAALISDALLSRLFGRFSAAAAAMAAFVFCVASVSEVCDYENTARKDFQVVSMAAERAAEFSGGGDIEIDLEISAPIYFPQNAPFNDHIMSVRGSAWGLSGPVKALTGRKDITVNVRGGSADVSGGAASGGGDLGGGEKTLCGGNFAAVGGGAAKRSGES